MSQPRVFVKPFLKWAGGKSQLLGQLGPLLPTAFNRYHEPFLGGGAVFFALSHRLAPERVMLSDANEELIQAYKVVRDRADELIDHLRTHVNERTYYDSVRALSTDSLTDVERASRFIFLNKTCYNGLYRVNRAGGFNVPFGRYKKPNFVNEEGLLAASKALQGVSLEVRGFDACFDFAKRGDFVYLDPPYHPVSTTANFTSYTGTSFGKDGQRRLRDMFVELDRRGCYIMMSNSDTEFIRALYEGYDIQFVKAKRTINSAANKRGPINEVVVRNYSSVE